MSRASAASRGARRHLVQSVTRLSHPLPMPKSSYDLHRQQIESKREPVMQTARELFKKSEYAHAIALVRAADPTCEGDVAMSRLLEDHLRELLSANPPTDKRRLETVFRHAVDVAQHAYPDPHTAFEADDFAAGRA